MNDFLIWLREVNRALFKNTAESVFDYLDVPWETWFRERITVAEARRRFNEEA